ncbi:hypothetical protein J6W32_04470 [bacterium]|nr:hypothetical protein [bacterium]MBP5783817.1 hypothetical protein [bacterium]
MLNDYEINHDAIIFLNQQINLASVPYPDDFELRLQKIKELNQALATKIDFNAYDLIIDMTAFQSVSLMHATNYVFVQQYQPT